MAANIVSAFGSVPSRSQGLVRDLRVRWALEEAGEPYQERLLTFGERPSDDYLRLQPFGQVPAFEDGEVAIFESGAIVLHIAERSPALLPADPVGRARAKTWIFAALNTVEPPILFLRQIGALGEDSPLWAGRETVLGLIRNRLVVLERWLDGREHLEDGFTAGDLLLIAVLRGLRGTDLPAEFPQLDAYRHRGEARPAFQRALQAQLETYERHRS